MKRYIALFEYEEGKNGFGVVFPDIPGCFSAGDTYEEAYRMAHEALALHLEDEKKLPKPRTLEQIKKEWKDWEKWEKNYKFIPVHIALILSDNKLRKINVAIPETLLYCIDSITKNRSEFITQAIEKSFSEYKIFQKREKQKGQMGKQKGQIRNSR
jgi:predicted RNase H-like HicB family nuclease